MLKSQRLELSCQKKVSMERSLSSNYKNLGKNLKEKKSYWHIVKLWEVSNLLSFVDGRLVYVMFQQKVIFLGLYIIVLLKTQLKTLLERATSLKTTWSKGKKNQLGLRNLSGKKQSPHIFCIVTHHLADALPVWKHWGIRWYIVLHHGGVHGMRKPVIISATICLSWNGCLPRIHSFS